jgi:hypothetical protein
VDAAGVPYDWRTRGHGDTSAISGESSPDLIAVRPHRFAENMALLFESLATPSSSRGMLGSIQSIAYQLQPLEVDWNRNHRIMAPGNREAGLLRFEAEIFYNATAGIRGNIDSVRANYRPDLRRYNRLDTLYRAPNADEVLRLIGKIDRQCSPKK